MTLQEGHTYLTGRLGRDWEHKTIVFGPLFEPTGDMDAEIAELRAYFRGLKGKYPHAI